MQDLIPMNVMVQGGLVDLIPMNVMVQGGLVDLIAMNVIVQGGLVDLIPMNVMVPRGAGSFDANESNCASRPPLAPFHPLSPPLAPRPC